MDDEDGTDQKSILPDESTMNKGPSGSNSNSKNPRSFQMTTIGQRQVTSTSNMNIQRNQNQNQNQRRQQQQDRDQNRNPNTTPSNSNDKSNGGIGNANGNGKRPLTPSMGGFHFPPGMNPLQMQNLNANGTLNPSNGIKRPADGMTCSDGVIAPGNGNGYRGSRPGLELQRGAQFTIRREPFEVGEGGNVKRIRR